MSCDRRSFSLTQTFKGQRAMSPGLPESAHALRALASLARLESILVLSGLAAAVAYQCLTGRGIRMQFDGHRLIIEPDVAIVDRGERVQWQCIGILGEQQLWTVAFQSTTPFAQRRFEAASPAKQRGGEEMQQQYAFALDAGPAETEGDHKYDVEIRESGRQRIVVDPWIIVR
jgi:hypothetical protein